MGLNRIANVNNPYQGNFRRVLCVCSAGLLRSPTAAYVLSQEPFNRNTRAAGMNKEYALVSVDAALLQWAQEVVAMEVGHETALKKLMNRVGIQRPIVTLNVPDQYPYRDPALVELIRERYGAYVNDTEG